jgi:hypothetical protein
MKQMPLSALLFLLIFINNNISAQEDDSWKKEISNPKLNPASGNVLIIGDDRSGSTKNQRQLSAEEYKTIIEAYINKYSGVVAVRVIGNPASQNLEFFRYKPKPTYIVPDLNAIAKKYNLTLSNRALAKKSIDSISKKNEEILKSNANNKNLFIESITNSIINYKPNGKDVTDINDFIEHLNIIINEPQYKGKKIDIILQSDGVHDANKKPVTPITFEIPVRLFLIGWKNKAIFQGNRLTINYFESKEGLLESISEIL